MIRISLLPSTSIFSGLPGICSSHALFKVIHANCYTLPSVIGWFLVGKYNKFDHHSYVLTRARTYRSVIRWQTVLLSENKTNLKYAIVRVEYAPLLWKNYNKLQVPTTPHKLVCLEDWVYLKFENRVGFFLIVRPTPHDFERRLSNKY